MSRVNQNLLLHSTVVLSVVMEALKAVLYWGINYCLLHTKGQSRIFIEADLGS